MKARARPWGVWCTPRRGRLPGQRPNWLRIGHGMRPAFATRREALAESRRRFHAFDGVYMGSNWWYTPKRLLKAPKRKAAPARAR